MANGKLNPVVLPIQLGNEAFEVRGLFGLDNGVPFKKIIVQNLASQAYITERSLRYILRNAEPEKVFRSGPLTVTTVQVDGDGYWLKVVNCSGPDFKIPPEVVREIDERMTQAQMLMNTYDLDRMRVAIESDGLTAEEEDSLEAEAEESESSIVEDEAAIESATS